VEIVTWPSRLILKWIAPKSNSHRYVISFSGGPVCIKLTPMLAMRQVKMSPAH
jgi:hypothetical protein